MKSTTTLFETAESTGVLLATVVSPDMTVDEANASMDELARLCEALSYVVKGRTQQRKAGYGSATVFGEGKLAEVAQLIVASQGQINIIVFDRELSPLQTRNVEDALNEELTKLGTDFAVLVQDRTSIIIDIFFKHAKSRQAKLQVEIAKLRYSSPRIRDEEYHGDRQGGGIGAKGAGETKAELRRRLLRHRVAELRRELTGLVQENDHRRERREGQTVGLVGYTNSGKSSLMRALTESEIYVADKLFATLDVTTRQMQPPVVPSVLITDTVGFVNFLPHDLVASFKSTLAEANNADLLLQVVDVSDPRFRIHIQTTDDVLKELGAGKKSRQLVFNKIDKASAADLAVVKNEFPTAWFLSALDKENVHDLHRRIVSHFESQQKVVQVHVPFAESKAIGEIRKVASVLKEEFIETGAILDLQLKPVDLDRLRSHFTTLDFKDSK